MNGAAYHLSSAVNTTMITCFGNAIAGELIALAGAAMNNNRNFAYGLLLAAASGISGLAALTAKVVKNERNDSLYREARNA